MGQATIRNEENALDLAVSDSISQQKQQLLICGESSTEFRTKKARTIKESYRVKCVHLGDGGARVEVTLMEFAKVSSLFIDVFILCSGGTLIICKKISTNH